MKFGAHDAQGLLLRRVGQDCSLSKESGQDFQESLDAQTCPPGKSGQVAIVTSKEVASLRHEMLGSVLSVQALVGL